MATCGNLWQLVTTCGNLWQLVAPKLSQVGFQHVDFTITSVTGNVPYKFGLWITQVRSPERHPEYPRLVQIDCYDGTSVMAPGGCSQLHFGMEGVIKSFNFEGVSTASIPDDLPSGAVPERPALQDVHQGGEGRLLHGVPDLSLIHI